MSNTLAPELVTASLKKGALTVLQNKFSPLRAISRSWEPDPQIPRAICEVKLVTSGATTMTNPTSFESGDSAVSAVTIPVNQYTQAFQISNADAQGGLALDDLVQANVGAFAKKIMQTVQAPMTTGNFTAEPYISAPAAFALGDLAILRGRLKKARQMNIMLDGDYFSMITNQPGYYQPTGTSSGAGWRPFGWDFLGECSDWSGAGENVRGFACDPSALGIVCGLPIEPYGFGQVLTSESVELPDLGIKVAYHVWFALSTRTLWASYDLMPGVAVGDASAGILIKSA